MFNGLGFRDSLWSYITEVDVLVYIMKVVPDMVRL